MSENPILCHPLVRTEKYFSEKIVNGKKEGNESAALLVIF